MSATNPHPPEDRLLALLDGELSPADFKAVRTHLASCDTCRDAHQELQSVREMLAVDAGSPPLRPVWPAVRERLTPRPRFTPTFVLGTALAAVAGLVLGLSLQALEPTSSTLDTSVDDTWTDVGTSLGSSSGLYELYFGETTETTP